VTTLREFRIALQVFQSNRLRRDYSDLAAIPQYGPVGEFFFEEMYGPRDFTARDTGAQRIHNFLHFLPGVHLRDIEGVLELLELTNELDHAMARTMYDDGMSIDFDEATYEHYYRLANNYDERLRQLHLIDSSTRTVFQLSRSALLGIALHRAGFLAILAGIEEGHAFLVKGYDALRGVSDISLFADTIHERELVRLKRIFGRA
jgi:hypothetical protein